MHSLSFQEKDLYVQISFSGPAEALLFVERYTTKKKEYPLTKNKDMLQARLAEQDLLELLTEGKNWDVYITFQQDERTERIRLANNGSELELFPFLTDESMLMPFTTRYGNVCFKSQPIQPLIKVEQVRFVDKHRIEFSGWLFHAAQTCQDTTGALLVGASEESYHWKARLQLFARPDLAGQASPIGFQASIPLEAVFLQDNGTLKAWIEVANAAESNKPMIAPVTLKASHLKKQKLLVKRAGKTMCVSIIKTKKGQRLHIKVQEYSLRQSLKDGIKRRLISLKRHRLVKKAYLQAFHYIGKIPGRKNIVVFESFLGKQFSDNPRAIYEYLREHDYPYKLYWSVDKQHLHNFQGKGLNCIRRFSLKWLFIMPRAKFWVTNSRMPLWLPKPKHTTYLQTWHGTPLKRLAADMEEVHMPGTTAEAYKQNFIKEAQRWDYLISPNAYSTEIFRRAFQFDKEMLETGYPRNDFIRKSLDQKIIGKLKAFYNIPLDKKVILYAPTWRDNQFHAKGKYRFDVSLDLDLLQERLGEDYVMLFRLHYLVSENLDLTPYAGFAYDFSNHEDIRELYIMADVLVTDYSSVFFDYGNLKRPMIFYVYDIEQYRDSLRGFYFNFEQEAPGPLVRTTAELAEAIKQVEADGFQQSAQFQQFYEKFCYLESGESTRRVVEKLF
nr:CDP-glycerol glycerophosphotransferase family protein [Ectobacillus ponti]